MKDLPQPVGDHLWPIRSEATNTNLRLEPILKDKKQKLLNDNEGNIVQNSLNPAEQLKNITLRKFIEDQHRRLSSQLSKGKIYPAANAEQVIDH